jgi:hypothetical protein
MLVLLFHFVYTPPPTPLFDRCHLIGSLLYSCCSRVLGGFLVLVQIPLDEIASIHSVISGQTETTSCYCLKYSSNIYHFRNSWFVETYNFRILEI